MVQHQDSKGSSPIIGPKDRLQILHSESNLFREIILYFIGKH